MLHILILVAIYAVLSTSLDLLVGHTGLLSVTHAALFGIGAYTSALLAVVMGAPFVIGVLAGMTIAAFVSLIISLPSLRLHDDYFVIATFGFQMILFSVLNNWQNVTRGPLGITNIPRPSVLGMSVSSRFAFLVLALSFAAFAYVIVNLIASSPFGRVLRAIREDEVFVSAVGKQPLTFKVIAFAVSSALAASAGSFYAHYITYIDPTSFTVMESILVISMVIIGGSASLWGPLIGAFTLVSLPEILRFIGLPTATAANLRQIIYGTLLVVIMIFRPRGLVGKYGFGR